MHAVDIDAAGAPKGQMGWMMDDQGPSCREAAQVMKKFFVEPTFTTGIHV